MKAVITAAGLSTDIMPLGKNIPKEMLPVGKKPALQLVVEEAMASDIKDILIVVGQCRRLIQDYFNNDTGLENLLRKSGLPKEAEELRNIPQNIHYITQPQPLGLGDAILYARDHIGDEDFLLMLGDDIIMGCEEPVAAQLCMVHRGTGKTIVGVEKSSRRPPTRGAVITGDHLGPSPPSFLINAMTQKIPKGAEGLLTTGRYIFTPAIFDILREKRDNGEKLELTQALDHLAKKEGAIAVQHTGKRYDMGNPEDWLEANRKMWHLDSKKN